MEKIIRIKEVGVKVEIYKRGFVRTPITLSLNDEQINRLVNLYRGPKEIYCVNPNNSKEEVRLTPENACKSIEELFPEKVEEVAEAPKNEEVQTLDELIPTEAFESAAVEPVENDTPAETVEEVVTETAEKVAEETPAVEEPVAATANTNENKYNKYNNYKKKNH